MRHNSYGKQHLFCESKLSGSLEWWQPNVIFSEFFIFGIERKFRISLISVALPFCPEYTRCSISVQPNDNVCQLRIDLLDFSLAPPTGDGICSTDVISISGSASNIPALCGENAGQHLIADFSGSNPISIVIKSTSTYTFGRHWNIRLSQIACDSGDRGKAMCESID